MTIFELMAKLVLDTSQYDKGLDDSEKEAEGFGGKLKGALATGAKVGGAALAAAGAAAGVLTKELISGVNETAAYGDNIDKMSQKLGISAEAYQEWDAIMQHSGASIESMTGAMKTMQLAAENGSDAFEQLGISQEELANMSTEDMFSAVITGLQGMEAGSERTKLATELLGRGATELGALLNTSAEDTEAMRQRVHELGGVMSNEAVKASAAYQDSMQDLKTSMGSLKTNIMSQFMPAMTNVINGLTQLFSGNAGSGTEMIIEGIRSVGDGIKQALPTILAKLKEILTGLLNMIVEALPEFLDMGFKLIGEMIQGLSNNMPQIIAKILEVATQLLSTLVKKLPEFLAMGVKLIAAIIDGLVKALPDILKSIGKIASDAGKAFMEYDWLSLGKNIVDGIVSGITNFGGAIGNKLSEMAKDAWKKVKNFFGISSPSKLMRDTIGRYLPEGIAVGIEANADSVTKAMNDLADMTVDAYNPEIGLQVGGQYTTVTDEISSLKDAIMNMQIILDTGLMVGGLAEGMDNTLGTFAARSHKGM